MADDKGFGKKAKKETAGAIGSIFGGIWLGGKTGAFVSSYTGNPWIIGGATIVGGVVGGIAGESAAETLVESIPESSYKGELILNKR